MAKEKSITELRDEKTRLVQRSKEITDKAKGETRKLSDDEMKEINETQVRLAEINTEILAHEEINQRKGKQYKPAGDGKFSLRRAIVAHMTGHEQRETEAIAIAEATKRHQVIAGDQEMGSLIIPFETRAAYTAGTEATAGVVIDEDQMELLLPLESNLVLTQAGVRMMTGLVGNIYWPKHSAAKVFWEGENDEAQDGSGAFSKGTLFSPKRLTSYVDISKQLLIQENRSVEGLIRQLLAVAIAQKVEQTAFGGAKDSDDASIITGLFEGSVENLGAISWANIVKLETSSDLQNALFGNLAYILHPSLLGAAKTKVKDSSGAGGFIFGNDGAGTLNGYKALRTNNIPKELGGDEEDPGDEFGIVFGNWADYFLGQWGGIDLTVDQYTQATKGMVRLVVNSYWNMGKIRDESFSVASMK